MGARSIGQGMSGDPPTPPPPGKKTVGAHASCHQLQTFTRCSDNPKTLNGNPTTTSLPHLTQTASTIIIMWAFPGIATMCTERHNVENEMNVLTGYLIQIDALFYGCRD